MPAQTAATIAIRSCGRGTGLFYDAQAHVRLLTRFFRYHKRRASFRRSSQVLSSIASQGLHKSGLAPRLRSARATPPRGNIRAEGPNPAPTVAPHFAHVAATAPVATNAGAPAARARPKPKTAGAGAVHAIATDTYRSTTGPSRHRFRKTKQRPLGTLLVELVAESLGAHPADLIPFPRILRIS
jgi:hypothetical protein